MKLTIPRTNLQAALAAVKPVARNPSPPILSNVLLVAKATPGSGSLTLTATDLDLHLRVTLNAAVAAEGKTTVRAALLSDIIRMADVPDVSLELVKNQLRIECGNLPRAELLRAVERIALVSDGVTFEFTGAALRLHSAGKRGASMVGEASDSLLIPANIKCPVQCTYSARYVCDTLTAIADDTLEFHLAPTGLGLFKTPSRDWRAVIAPVKKEKSKGDPQKPEPKPETTTPVK
jgi:hypothetical protein